MSDNKAVGTARIDWRDVLAGLAIGFLYAIVKALELKVPAWRVGVSSANVPCILTVAYIIWRARREPAKLDAWGLTTPITGMAVLVMTLFLVLTAVALAVAGRLLGGEILFEASYVFRMIDYIVGAFPQQFFLCSVGLATLSTVPALRGPWRLPLMVGLCFGVAHFWSPVHLPGSVIPLQVAATAPMGFFAAWYFLRFRNILPLTAFHAINFVLFTRWVEHLL